MVSLSTTPVRRVPSKVLTGVRPEKKEDSGSDYIDRDNENNSTTKTTITTVTKTVRREFTTGPTEP